MVLGTAMWDLRGKSGFWMVKRRMDMETKTPTPKNQYLNRDISVSAWERAMIRGMISEMKRDYPLSNNEQVWVEEMLIKFQE